MKNPNQIALKVKPSAQVNSYSILNLGFRPFFLMGAFIAVFYLLLWVIVFVENINLPVYGGGLWWHIHEMLYGFVGAIIVGFLLTAVQNWTQIPGLNGMRLLALVILWLAGRIAMFTVSWIHPGWIALIDLLFFPTVAVILAVPILKRKMWRNLIFIPILLLMTYTNAHMHCAVFLSGYEHLFIASHNQVLLVVLLMVIIGGRVIPMFTANGTGTPRVEAISIVEKSSVGMVILIVIINMFSIEITLWLKALLFSLAAVLHGIRVFRWRIWVTWQTPMVLFLHISYWCIPIGLLLYSLSEYALFFSRSQAIHTLTVGAMGLMILSMISRVSLGHTGRPIVAGKMMTIAFVFVCMAFLVRVFGGLVFNYTQLLITSAGFWIIGYSLFLSRFYMILTTPRADGKSG